MKKRNVPISLFCMPCGFALYPKDLHMHAIRSRCQEDCMLSCYIDMLNLFYQGYVYILFINYLEYQVSNIYGFMGTKIDLE